MPANDLTSVRAVSPRAGLVGYKGDVVVVR